MTQRTRSGFAAEIAAELPNNTSRAISPQDVRDNFTDLSDSVPWYDEVLYPNATANLTAGYTTDLHDIGTITTGTVTPAFANGGMQIMTNNGAFTLAPPASGNGQILLQVTNGASAGAVTTSGFTSVDGDTFATANAANFLCAITKFGARSYLTVIAASDNS